MSKSSPVALAVAASCAVAATAVWAAWRRSKQVGKLVQRADNGVELRFATIDDVDEILRLIKALAVYEKEPDAVEIDAATLARDGFGPAPAFECLLTRCDGDARPCGFALFFTSFSTWTGKCTYLEDLFVEDTHRGRGVGGLLLKGLCRIAHERGSARFHWQALDWNAPALDFYKAVGAARLDEWVNLRMDKPAMRAYLGL